MEKLKQDEKETRKLQDNLQSLQLRLGAREHAFRSLQEKVRIILHIGEIIHASHHETNQVISCHDELMLEIPHGWKNNGCNS